MQKNTITLKLALLFCSFSLLTLSAQSCLVNYNHLFERSEDKTNFIPLIEQLRDENAEGQCVFTDYYPIENAYCRAKLTDLGDEITYTNTVEVKAKSSANFEIMPNPGTNELKVEWTYTVPQTIKTVNPLGQEIEQIQTSTENSLRFETESWGAVTYLVVETETGESVYKKWVKL